MVTLACYARVIWHLGQRIPSTRPETHVVETSLSLLIIIRWANNLQSMGRSNLLRMPTLTGHPTDPVAAYGQLLVVSPTASPNKPLLTITHGGRTTLVTVSMLVRAFSVMVKALGLDPGLYSIQSLRRGGATSAYRAGVAILEVKWHGLWSSEAFWAYIISPCVATSPVACALATAAKNSL